MPAQAIQSKKVHTRLRSRKITLSLIGAGTLLLIWMALIIWGDIVDWNKDIGTIFFGSRIGEDISLGIGMTIFNYFLVSIALIGAGVVLFIRNTILVSKQPRNTRINAAKAKISTPQQTPKKSIEIKQETSSLKVDSATAKEERFFSGCLHHFGYLSSRPRDSPIPQECILCQRLGDCMVATVYVKKLSDE